jgi:predicted ATPase
MRLYKLTIGSANEGPAHQFKNLKDVTIDFDQDHWVTVVIGWNGTGKSNVLEALAVIFRDLIMGKDKPEFSYQLVYRCHGKKINIDADPDRERDIFRIHSKQLNESQVVTQEQSTLFACTEEDKGEPVPYRRFLKQGAEFLPRYIFGYYSGLSDRLQDIFKPYLRKYDEALRQGKDPGLRRLFYALPVHSQFVLLAFIESLQKPEDKAVSEFLVKEVGLDPIEGIESILFVVKQPPWDRNPSNRKKAEKSGLDFQPDIFWGAEGIVRLFLDRLLVKSLAPIKIKRRVKESLWGQGHEYEFVYLYLKDNDALDSLRGGRSGKEFFKELESTYVSELIEEVRIRVKLRKNDGSVTFRELSEGEQQLLTVLGLLRFTAEDESLFLLDEPDTHLNPRWCVDYLRYLKDFVGTAGNSEESSHIVLTTHNPLAIAELVRQQVQILRRDDETRAIESRLPEIDPRGMGYAGIVTSDMFGLAAALDHHTQELLENKRKLTLKTEPLDDSEREELENINLELEGYGFRYSMRDPLFEEYLRARYAYDRNRAPEIELSKKPMKDRRLISKMLLEEAAKKVRNEQ